MVGAEGQIARNMKAFHLSIATPQRKKRSTSARMTQEGMVGGAPLAVAALKAGARGHAAKDVDTEAEDDRNRAARAAAKERAQRVRGGDGER